MMFRVFDTNGKSVGYKSYTAAGKAVLRRETQGETGLTIQTWDPEVWAFEQSRTNA